MEPSEDEQYRQAVIHGSRIPSSISSSREEHASPTLPPRRRVWAYFTAVNRRPLQLKQSFDLSSWETASGRGLSVDHNERRLPFTLASLRFQRLVCDAKLPAGFAEGAPAIDPKRKTGSRNPLPQIGLLGRGP